MLPTPAPAPRRLWAALLAARCASLAPARAAFTFPLKEYVTVFDSPAPGTPRGRRRIHVSEYYGRVEMGNPPQAFDVVFDTGSGNIVLPTSKCSDEACQRHRRFASADSKSAVQLAYEDGTVVQPGDDDRDKTTITYGTGKLTGEYIRDRVCMGGRDGGPGQSGAPVCTTVDFLGVVEESRFPFTELPFDGIFGLGLTGLAAGPDFNFVSRLKGNSSVVDPVFAVFLRNLTADEDSEITIGGFRPERLRDGAAGLTWLPVPQDEADDEGYWLVTMRDVYVGGKALGACDDFSDRPRCKVAMDTGSSLMMGPRVQVRRLLDAIGGCSQPLPQLTFVLDGPDNRTFEVVLDPADYAEVSDEGCGIAFQAIDLPPSLGAMWVFGQTVLRKYYSVYDAKRWRVGIGLAQHATAQRLPPPAPTVPPVPQKAEVCEDDNNNMVWNHLPGCKSFAAMGYCGRFVPLAHRYCRLSCELCTALGASAARPASALARSSSPSSGSSPSALEEESTGEGVRVRGKGLTVGSVRRQVVLAGRAPGALRASGWRL